MIKISGVPEHFNYPMQLALKHFPEFTWNDCFGGSGEMRQLLQKGETDFAIMLTEAAVFAIESGDAIEIVQEYVSTPLHWGIYSNAKLPALQAENEANNLLVSRLGSGSHLIPFAQAAYREYAYNPNIEVISNLKGALEYFESGKNGLFYWEEATTEPFVNKNTIQKIGVYPTPWPCFVIVKRKDCTADSQLLLNQCKKEAKDLKQNIQAINTISDVYGLDVEETKTWFNRTEWFQDKLQPSHLKTIAEILRNQGLI